MKEKEKKDGYGIKIEDYSICILQDLRKELKENQ
jgi:hypothetical protein